MRGVRWGRLFVILLHPNSKSFNVLRMESTAQWIVKDVRQDLLEQVDQAAAAAPLAPLVRRLLAQRGIADGKTIERFLSPRLQDLADPFLLPDMPQAIERLLQAIDGRERVVLYGDYDVDGVTSIALLQEVLRGYGLDCSSFLPHRLDEGYGISRIGVDRS